MKSFAVKHNNLDVRLDSRSGGLLLFPTMCLIMAEQYMVVN